MSFSFLLPTPISTADHGTRSFQNKQRVKDGLETQRNPRAEKLMRPGQQTNNQPGRPGPTCPSHQGPICPPFWGGSCVSHRFPHPARNNKPSTSGLSRCCFAVHPCFSPSICSFRLIFFF
ncbi:hypothetical protein B0T26DRAFT_686406 [Lasiosphaeria miniovina]|uniref:Uncharacterized protein n=1 Tax=Lasiosphaeria miniovina TaxID=1954250 RepID=A0AA40BGR4_9PEZI|nr:uncharacterized protein B0T26DRAFT_686406 [Lasiosphaeria miniovina]KAK0733916.1 hypothetical protein B0T26DRAFT_686406 [Lasiosphaeria miniovina]